MTLILSVVTPEVVAQASDRRLTDSSGRVVDDQANKTMIVACRDADLLISFTGYAGDIDGSRMDRMDFKITDFLTKPWANTLNLDQVLANLRNRLTAHLNSLKYPKNVLRLTVVICGWRFTTKTAVHAVVSNCIGRDHKSTESARPRFSVFIQDSPSPIFVPFGTTASNESWQLATHLEAELKDLVISHRDYSEIMAYLVELIREEADDPLADNRIGKNCMATVLYTEARRATARFYPEDESVPTTFYPNLINDRNGNGLAIMGAGTVGGLLEPGWTLSFDSELPGDELKSEFVVLPAR